MAQMETQREEKRTPAIPGHSKDNLRRVGWITVLPLYEKPRTTKNRTRKSRTSPTSMYPSIAYRFKNACLVEEYETRPGNYGQF